jgi:hypothetical protein
MDNLNYQEFKGETTILPEFGDCSGVTDIDLLVIDPLFFQCFFELFTLRVFFFGVNNQFSHSLPSCIIAARYRIIVRGRCPPINPEAGSGLVHIR